MMQGQGYNNAISLSVFDPAASNIMAQSLEILVQKLNQISSRVKFTSGGVQNKFYMQEISEFVLLVNNEHILTNENKFKLNKIYQDEKEIDDLARYFQKVLETAIGLVC